ncbi:MAG: hypothetical protein ABFD50_21805 [Smithella sp.]
MKFKLPELKEQFWRLRSKTRLIVCDIENYCIEHFNIVITLTDIFRPYDEYNPISPHPYWRAVDIRVHDPITGMMIFTDEQIDELLNHINVKYDYGDERHRTIMCHEVFDKDGKSKGIHFHVQTREDGRA